MKDRTQSSPAQQNRANADPTRTDASGFNRSEAPRLADLQSRFKRGLLTGDIVDATALILGGAIDPNDRFEIYRNNTKSSLGHALAATYPVVEKLVGEEFFRFVAKQYVQIHPPMVPQLLAYGGEMATFLAHFPPAQSVPYLPDMARLEWARTQSYFAPDAENVAPDALAAVPPDDLAAVQFSLHPTVRLVGSAHPVFRIWNAHQGDRTPTFKGLTGPDYTLLSRFGTRVRVEAIGLGLFAFLTALDHGLTLAEAAQTATEADQTFDLQGGLTTALTRGLFSKLVPPAA